MKATERRKAIANLLLSSGEAISGGALSEQFGVSRQIIVQDISVLKASGYDILSTHSGYIISKSPLKERIFKIHHTTEQTEEELNLIVDLGGTVADVFVWHKVYGKVSAPLNIFSRLQVKQFIDFFLFHRGIFVFTNTDSAAHCIKKFHDSSSVAIKRFVC